jgi:hypothetical protein
MDLKPAQIRLHIGELVMNGVPVSDPDALGDAIRGELTRLLSAGALPAALADSLQIPSLNAGALRVTSSQPRVLGMQVAQAVHRSLGK